MNDDTNPSAQTYGINNWGSGYFSIEENGHLAIRPDPDGETRIDFLELANRIRGNDLSWPVLVRFTDILRHRVERLCAAFQSAAEEVGYQGGYNAIYPIKVNQQRSVVEEIVNSGGDCVGLEAGSKPELMAVLAQSKPGGIIVCNGYKDREYIRLALIGTALGHKVYIVIEKPSELNQILNEAEDLDVTPLLGVRVRLSSLASGKWQNSGGDKSKFGLTSLQLLQLIEQLRSEDKLHCLQLMHTHIGSQIPNLRDIRRSLSEVARFYAQFRRYRIPIDVIDVGGGLGVDYEGTATRHYCSMNYTMESYAREIIKTFKLICQEEDLPHPNIFTESGRALTAHHAVLITNVSDREHAPEEEWPDEMPEYAPEVLQTLQTNLMSSDQMSPMELYQEARHGLDESNELFQQGLMSLEHRALAEQLFYTTCHQVRPRLNNTPRQRETLDEVNEALADKLFMNLSLFQSLPDVWAIDQIFPVLPLHRHNEEASRSGILHDLTCDSDGCFSKYVDQDGVETTLPIHPTLNDEEYLFGFFLVGAYQEILGDMHNLFGDTNTINVELSEHDGYRLSQPEKGDTVDELLRYVHFDTDTMLECYRKKIKSAELPARSADQFYDELKAGLHGYTYLED